LAGARRSAPTPFRANKNRMPLDLSISATVPLRKQFACTGAGDAPAAFIGMLEGRNFGKALVRVARSD
jgi:hypothetical protein